MDVFKFVNSKDVREYLKGIDYKFSAPDAAWIVDRCVGLSMKEKIAVWKEIMKNMPDCRYESPYGLTKSIDSFHKALTEYIDLKNDLLEEFQNCGDKEYYEYDYVHEHFNGFIGYIGSYASYEECSSKIRMNINTGKDIIGYIIRKTGIGTGISVHCRYSYSGDLLDVSGQGHYDSKEYYRISNLFSNMWPDIPVPFKKGDILRFKTPYGRYDEQLTVMSDLRTMSKDDIDIFGNEDRIKRLIGFFQTDIGTLTEKQSTGHYIDFEYCPEGFLEGKEKILESLSNYLKGKISLECFVNDYHLIILKAQIEDIRAEQMFSRASMDV